MMAAAKRAETAPTVPTLNHSPALAGGTDINPTRMELTMVSNTPPPNPGATHTAPVGAPTALDLIWGARAIAQVLGCTERKTFHMLEKGELPMVRQVGSRWVASRKALEAFFVGEAA